jgi:RNA polymerase sigma factor (sigma-70 family)
MKCRRREATIPVTVVVITDPALMPRTDDAGETPTAGGGGSPRVAAARPWWRARKAKRADAAAFAAVYEEHHQAIYRYCRSILRHEADAWDALQSTMAKAFAALQREECASELRPWLFRIAHNESVSLLRQRARFAELEDVPDIRWGECPSERLDDRERLGRLWVDLHDLSERQRAALVLRELNGLGHSEIAKVLGCSTAAAKQAIFEARVALHDCAAGRDTACEEIERRLSERDGRTLRSRRLRAHIRACDSCRRFESELGRRPAQIAVLAPPLPLAAGAMLLVRAIRDARALVAGSAAGGAGTASAIGASAGGAVTATAVSASAGVGVAAKAALAVVAIGAATVGGATLGGSHHHAPRAPHVATSARGAAVSRSALRSSAAPRMAPRLGRAAPGAAHAALGRARAGGRPQAAPVPHVAARARNRSVAAAGRAAGHPLRATRASHAVAVAGRPHAVPAAHEQGLRTAHARGLGAAHARARTVTGRKLHTTPPGAGSAAAAHRALRSPSSRAQHSRGAHSVGSRSASATTGATAGSRSRRPASSAAPLRAARASGAHSGVASAHARASRAHDSASSPHAGASSKAALSLPPASHGAKGAPAWRVAAAAASAAAALATGASGATGLPAGASGATGASGPAASAAADGGASAATGGGQGQAGGAHTPAGPK